MLPRRQFESIHKAPPNPLEEEQLIRFTRCNVCGKSPCKFFCGDCRCVGYCSSACERTDDAHQKGDEVCQKLAGTTAGLKVVCEQGGSRPGMCTKFGSECDLLECAKRGDAESYFATEMRGVDILAMAKSGRGLRPAGHVPSMLPFLKYALMTDFRIDVPTPENTGVPIYLMVPGFQLTIFDGLSQQLTVLHTVARLAHDSSDDFFAERDDIVIHIIGAESGEFSGANAWEELLHRYPSAKRLRIFLIGPLSLPLPLDEVPGKCCQICSSREAGVTIRSICSTYEDFASSKEYVEPTFCVAFNCGFSENDTSRNIESESLTSMWQPALQLLADRCAAPLLITGYNCEEVGDDVALATELGLKTVIAPERNPFASPFWLPDTGYAGLRGGGKEKMLYTENAFFAVLVGRKSRFFDLESSDGGAATGVAAMRLG